VDGVSYVGFEHDMMSGSEFNFSQVHIDNLASKALELREKKGDNFVMSIKVDNSGTWDKSKTPNTFSSGKTTYTKIEDKK